MVVKVNVNMNEQISKENAGVRPYLAGADWRGVRGQLGKQTGKIPIVSGSEEKSAYLSKVG